MENLELNKIYDEVTKCTKCGAEYGFDYPASCIREVCGKRIKIKPHIDNGLCPWCDPNLSKKFKSQKPKGLNTSEYSLNN
jgi:hypothetical protein